MNEHDLRKAAILVASLDTRTADELLEQMPSEQARRVRDEILGLDHIDPQEQQAVLDHFYTAATSEPPAESKLDESSNSSTGVEISPTLQARLAASDELSHEPQTPLAETVAAAPDFCFFRDAPIDQLVSFLATERPQTIALVLAHLTSGRAGEVLAGLPCALQPQVLRRLATLDQPHPEIVADIDRTFRERHADDSHGVDPSQLHLVEQILATADEFRQQEILTNLARYDARLAHRLGHRPPPEHSKHELLACRGAFEAELTPSTSRETELPARELPGPEPNAWNEPSSRGTRAGQSDQRPNRFDELIGGEPDELAGVACPDRLDELDSEQLAMVVASADPQVAQLAMAGWPQLRTEMVLQHLGGSLPVLDRAWTSLGPLRLSDLARAESELIEIARQLVRTGRLSIRQALNTAA